MLPTHTHLLLLVIDAMPQKNCRGQFTAWQWHQFAAHVRPPAAQP